MHQKLGKPIPPEVNLNTIAVNQPPSTPSQPSTQVQQNFPQATVISAPPMINMNRPIQPQLNAINTAQTDTAAIGPVQPEISATTAVSSETVPSGNSATTGSVDYSMQEDNDTSNNEPIGREYIETRIEGKILSFYCKLCDCQFNDPNAKDMHTKGRRHRLAYKKS